MCKYPVREIEILVRSERGSKERLSLWRTQHVPELHGQPIHFNKNFAMLHFTCGGAAEKLYTCCQLPCGLQQGHKQQDTFLLTKRMVESGKPLLLKQNWSRLEKSEFLKSLCRPKLI